MKSNGRCIIDHASAELLIDRCAFISPHSLTVGKIKSKKCDVFCGKCFFFCCGKYHWASLCHHQSSINNLLSSVGTISAYYDRVSRIVFNQRPDLILLFVSLLIVSYMQHVTISDETTYAFQNILNDGLFFEYPQSLF